jgi:hypothetical protein
MQQPEFRDLLWSVIDMSDRGIDVSERLLFEEMQVTYPELTRERFDELVEMLVLSEHLRKWPRPTAPGGDHTDVLHATAKARLQFATLPR